MRYFVGTSGYSYKEWKGSFYPETLPAGKMLSFYAERFSTVEINSTFRRLPSLSVIQSWAKAVPVSFRFVLKAPQAITHRMRLKDAEDATQTFIQAASALKRRRGPLLFQLPPNFKKDVPRLKAFLKRFGARAPAAFEFRHESWQDDEVYDCLRANSCALCVADTDERPNPIVISTTGWGFVRLRRKNYTAKRLKHWIERIRAQGWKDAYVFFKHEETGTGPKFAARFLELAEK